MYLFQQLQILQVVLLMFPIDEVIHLDMTFEEASKFIVSAVLHLVKIKLYHLLYQLYHII